MSTGIARRIKLMTDYGAHPLWWMDGGRGAPYNLDPVELPLRAETVARLEAWAEWWDSILDLDDPAASGFSSPAEELAFEQEGLALWAILREELAGMYEVHYFSMYNGLTP